MRLGNIVTVGVLSASHRLRRAWGIVSLLAMLLGLVLFGGAGAVQHGPVHGTGDLDAGAVGMLAAGYVLVFFGGIGLFWWLVAGVVKWLGRIVGEDTGLIERPSPVEVEPRGRLDYLD